MSMPVVLATGGFDHKIRLWDATSGTCPKIYRFGDSQVNCLATSTDKGLLVGGGNPLINLFDLKSQPAGTGSWPAVVTSSTSKYSKSKPPRPAVFARGCPAETIRHDLQTRRPPGLRQLAGHAQGPL